MGAMLWVLLLGPVQAAEEKGTDDGGPATAEQQAIVRALSVRHGAPACVDLGSLSADLVADLVWVADHVQYPPWVGLRAASCVVTAFPDAGAPALVRWASSPDTRGLAILITSKLDGVPDATAISVAEALVCGPWRDDLRGRLSGHPLAEIRALSAASTVSSPSAEGGPEKEEASPCANVGSR